MLTVGVPLNPVKPIVPLKSVHAPSDKLATVYPVALVRTPEDGVPSAGVTNVGELENTADPVPVSSVKVLAKFALDGVARKVATFDPSPETPVEIGNPVALVNTPEAGVPNAGVTRVGDVDPTKFPVPVCPVNELFTELAVVICLAL